MLDYAHNPDGFVQLAEFMKTVNASEKIGIITAPGDRRDEDLHKMGMLAAQMFDKIIIRHDNDCRGRTKENITDIIMKGIREADSSIEVNVISNEIEALTLSMQQAVKGSFIVNCIEKVKHALDFVTNAQENEKQYGAVVYTNYINN
jgi:cyanophycin synthetase